MLQNKEKRLLISLNDLNEFDSDLTKKLLKSPNEYLPPFEQALKEYISSLDPLLGKDPEMEFFIGIEGSFGSHHVFFKKKLFSF